MSNVSQIRSTFDAHLHDNWPYTRIEWENTNYNKKENRDWIRPTLVIDVTENAALATRVRHTGNYVVQVFSPLGKGTKDVYENSDKLIALFQNKVFNNDIFTYAGTARRIGDDGYGWYQVNVLLPFTADDDLLN